jgi:hypothetical protein
MEMARKKKPARTGVKQRFKDMNDGLLVQFAKEASTIPAYAMRELTGQPHGEKAKCTLKKGWFE